MVRRCKKKDRPQSPENALVVSVCKIETFLVSAFLRMIYCEIDLEILQNHIICLTAVAIAGRGD